MEKKFGRIETIGNRCFVDRGISCIVAEQSFEPPKIIKKEITVQPRKKPEKVNLKFGKIRVAVTGADRVKVKEEQNALVILLSDTSS